MNTSKTNRLVQANGVKTLKADKTDPAPEVDELLVELGNEAKAIPYVAIFPADGSQPILLEGFITQQQVLDALERAGPSLNGGRMAKTTSAP